MMKQEKQIPFGKTKRWKSFPKPSGKPFVPVAENAV